MAWTPRSHDFHSLKLLHAKTYLYAVGFLVSEKIFLKVFPHYKSSGDICCNGNQSSSPFSPESLCNLCPILILLFMEFDQNLPVVFKRCTTLKM